MNCRFFLALLFYASGYTSMVIDLPAQSNPFLRPGAKQKPPTVVRPAPPPPAPKPINSNLELRGFFKFQDTWHFAIFDKVKNKGFWLKRGESYDEGKVEIESFNPTTEVVKMKGGQTLSLKKSEHKVMAVPSAQPVKKTPLVKPPQSNIRLPQGNIPRVKIPPRNPIPPRKN